MSVGRTAVVLVLVLSLSGVVVAEHALVSAHRTVLDPAFVTESFDETDAYETSTDFALAGLTGEDRQNGSNGSNENSSNFVAEAATDAVLDPHYVQSQVEPNVGSLYRYLHGDGDLDLRIDTRPVKSTFVSNVETAVATRSPGELATDLDLNASLAEAGIPIDAATLVRLERSAADYDAVRSEVRAAVEAEVVASQRDAGVEPDPDRTAELTDAALARLNDEGHAAIALPKELTDTFGEEGTAAAEALGHTYVDALTGDQSFETFTDRVAGSQSALAVSVGASFAAKLDEEVADELVLSDELDPEAASALAGARTVVGVLDALVLALPVLAVCLLGGVWWLTRSSAAVLVGAGVPAAIVGGGSFLAGSQVGATLRGMATGGDVPAELVELALALADRTLAVFLGQSLTLAAVGVVCVCAGLALHLRARGSDARPVDDPTARDLA
ncbi:hypothetical protein [Haloarchaeobius sp. DFWS5]|uniref:hypothetical protein n=1 Tax=Haloarchaeobius sp. DFWS5 TaxID=3446114 RepID=UPI003EBAD3D3